MYAHHRFKKQRWCRVFLFFYHGLSARKILKSSKVTDPKKEDVDFEPFFRPQMSRASRKLETSTNTAFAFELSGIARSSGCCALDRSPSTAATRPKRFFCSRFLWTLCSRFGFDSDLERLTAAHEADPDLRMLAWGEVVPKVTRSVPFR